jgi:hypothetical protein
LSLQKGTMNFAVPASSAFQTGFVATIVHTMNAAIAAIKSINAPQQLQQTDLIPNDSVYVFRIDHQLMKPR